MKPESIKKREHSGDSGGSGVRVHTAGATKKVRLALFGCKEPPWDGFPSEPRWLFSLVLLSAQALPSEPLPCQTGCSPSLLAVPRPRAHHAGYRRPLSLRGRHLGRRWGGRVFRAVYFIADGRRQGKCTGAVVERKFGNARV